MSASCALALKVAAAKAAVSATACRALHIAAVLIGIRTVRGVGRRVRWPAVRWIIGLRVIRVVGVVVWGGCRGAKSGPCRDTCRNSAPAIIRVGPTINVRTTIDVRIRSARTNCDVTRIMAGALLRQVSRQGPLL